MEKNDETPKQQQTFEIRVHCNTATGEVKVFGPLAMKGFCIKALATAMQIVVDHVPPVIRPETVIPVNGKTDL